MPISTSVSRISARRRYRRASVPATDGSIRADSRPDSRARAAPGSWPQRRSPVSWCRAARCAACVTDRGVISAAAVVIAAGNRSASLVASVGVTLPIVLVRRHRLVVLDVPEIPRDAPMTIDEATGTHWRPAGGGAHVMWPDPDEPAGEPLDDVPTREAFAFAVLDPASPRAAARLAPFWRSVWSAARVRGCSRPGSTTSLPITARCSARHRSRDCSSTPATAATV